MASTSGKTSCRNPRDPRIARAGSKAGDPKQFRPTGAPVSAAGQRGPAKCPSPIADNKRMIGVIGHGRRHPQRPPHRASGEIALHRAGGDGGLRSLLGKRPIPADRKQLRTPRGVLASGLLPWRVRTEGIGRSSESSASPRLRPTAPTGAKQGVVARLAVRPARGFA